MMPVRTAAERRERYRADPDYRAHVLAYCELKRATRTEAERAAFKEYQKAYLRRPEVRRRYFDRYVQRNYRLSREQFDALLIAQSGRCAICTSALTGEHRSQQDIHIDHDHATGHVRGLLCGGCNVGLGAFRDRVESLRSAISYLEATE